MREQLLCERKPGLNVVCGRSIYHGGEGFLRYRWPLIFL